MLKVLVTGGAGFIGSHLIDYLISLDNYIVYSIDNFDDFYSKDLKLSNIHAAAKSDRFHFIEGDILNIDNIDFGVETFDIIVHLAAKAGVRPSINNPIAYEDVNSGGTMRMLEYARKKNIKQFVYASSSSVYGISDAVPWEENNSNLLPISPYASSKISGEWTGRVYSHLYDIRFIALRFFTVYGERQRPDLAINKFVKSICNGVPITMFGDGTTERDYTYWQDIIQGVHAAMHYHQSPYEIINIGNNQPITLAKLIQKIEATVGKKAIINQLPEQQGDVPRTFANISKAQNLLNYQPHTTLEVGLANFYEWMLTHSDIAR